MASKDKELPIQLTCSNACLFRSMYAVDLRRIRERHRLSIPSRPHQPRSKPPRLILSQQLSKPALATIPWITAIPSTDQGRLAVMQTWGVGNAQQQAGIGQPQGLGLAAANGLRQGADQGLRRLPFAQGTKCPAYKKTRRWPGL